MRGAPESPEGHPGRTPNAGASPGAVASERASSTALLALSFCLGVGALLLLPELPTAGVLWALTGLGVLGLAFIRPLAALLLGACWGLFHAGVLLWEPFPEALARAPLVVEGRIASIPADTGFARRFLFRVERAWREPASRSDPGGAPEPVVLKGLVRLSWYEGAPPLAAGERWRLPVRLKPRHGFANPGGFDYERWLFEQRIVATGSLRRGDPPERLDPGPGGERLTLWRQRLGEHLAGVLGDDPALPLIKALTIGDRSELSPEDWEVLTRTGTNHLVAISGLHVGLIAAALFVLVRRVWAWLPSLTLRIPAPRAAALAAMPAAVAYAALAGFAVSTQRALIMLAVVLAAVALERTLRPWHALVVALVGVLMLDPLAVLSYGTWLSFGAVAVLLWNLGGRLPRRDPWTRWGRAQWAVGLGLLPLVLGLFARASLIAPLVNLVAVPLFSLVLLPLVLVGAILSLIPGLTAPLHWSALTLGWCMDGLTRIAAWPWASMTLPAASPWAWVAAGLGVTLLLAPRGLPGRPLGLVLVLPMLLTRPPAPAEGEAWFTLLDVGQGLSAVVRTREGTLVYDTGPGFGSGFNTGSTVLVPFLRAQSVERVDVLILSHADRDHAGGAQALNDQIPLGRVLGGEPAELPIAGAGPCRAGDGWVWSGVRFDLLHPEGADESGNDASCVLRILVGGRSVLLTGDISARIERRLVSRMGRALASDVLVAGHHGSATSTSVELLDAVSPSLVLFASGYANHFGFPAEAVVARVAERGIPWEGTAVSGALSLHLTAEGEIRGPWAWRDRAARLWTHRIQTDP